MRKLTLVALAPALLVVACNTPQGSNKQEKKDAIVKMNNDVIKLFEEKKEAVAKKAKEAVGYACFSNTSVTFLFVGGGGGYGLATHNKTGNKVYMKVGSGNLGLGIGAKDYRLLMIFNTETAYQKFIQGSWTFGGEASAEAKGGDEGGGAAASGAVKQDVETFQITEDGAILAATITGGKFYRDKELN
ncbi:MAG: YSC84-related protein [Planctomycetota bacterium]|jgi:lipid-binding SYLF domain-containing protein